MKALVLEAPLYLMEGALKEGTHAHTKSQCQDSGSASKYLEGAKYGWRYMLLERRQTSLEGTLHLDGRQLVLTTFYIV